MSLNSGQDACAQFLIVKNDRELDENLPIKVVFLSSPMEFYNIWLGSVIINLTSTCVSFEMGSATTCFFLHIYYFLVGIRGTQEDRAFLYGSCQHGQTWSHQYHKICLEIYGVNRQEVPDPNPYPKQKLVLDVLVLRETLEKCQKTVLFYQIHCFGFSLISSWPCGHVVTTRTKFNLWPTLRA